MGNPHSSLDPLEPYKWLLEKHQQTESSSSDSYAPYYGDVTELNTEGVILNSVGEETLRKIAEDSIDLLGTSVAVYELNGDYAFGMFSSGWCRTMDAASRRLCDTNDNHEALNCGSWLCHENCWNDSAKAAMESKQSTDIQCIGGINLYGEPIYANGRVIGAINIGYGTPPTDPKNLKELSEKFNIELSKLEEQAKCYKPRPQFLIDLAKKRLKASARFIGELVEKSTLQAELKRKSDLLDNTNRMAKIGGWELDTNSLAVTWTDETYRIHELPLDYKPPLNDAINFFHPDDKPKLEESIQSALDKCEPYDMMLRFITAKGKHLWVRTKCEPEILEGRVIKLKGTFQDITERKKAEKLLQDKNQLIKNMFASVQEGIIVYGRDMRYQEWNPFMERLTGVSANESIGRHPLDVFHFLNEVGVIKNIEQALKGEIPEAIDFSFSFPNGRSGWVHDKTSPLYNAAGEVIGAIGTVSDITKRKNAEQELSQREAQYNAIVENTSDYIMRYDKNHRHIYANHSAIEVTGLSPDQYLGKTHQEMGFPEHLCTLWKKNIDDVFATGEVRRVEFDVELQDGIVSLDLQMNPEFTADGQVQSVIGVSRDITTLKEAQREDRLHKTRLEIINQIINTPDMTEKNICDFVLEKMVDLLDSKIGFFGFVINDEQEMLIHAWSSTAMTNCAIHEKPIVFPIETAGLWGEPVRNRKSIIINDYTSDHPSKKGYPKGHVHISRFLSVPIFDKGRIVAVASVANKTAPYKESDIRHFELLLRDAWEQVQRKRMEKEKETLTLKLQQAQKMESIGNLAGGIAHDFNNILFPIIGMSEMLLEDLPPGSIERENAEEIFKAGKRGSDLVKQILAFSRQSEHKLTPTRLQNIIKEVIKLSRASIPTYIEINQEIQQDCGLVMADPSQIHQIGMNLITNAYHAVEEKGGKIFIRLKQVLINDTEPLKIHLSPGAYTVLSISDTGHGMSEEIMGKIFDPYFTTKEQGKGTGLGLAVVYGIVKEHQGDIKVYSEIGKGSTFDIYLPLMKKDVRIESVHTPEAHRGGNERILLVDDEESVAKLEKQMLERMGYKVTCRLHSAEALEAFRANPFSFDLVVSDMSMPNIPGDELAQKIKSIRPDVPIIICTGFSERIHKDNIRQMGIDDLLMKPVVISDLAKTVRKILDESKKS